MPINHVGGPGATSFGSSPDSNPSVITVQAGDITIADVANRHKLDKDALLAANPQIKDPYQKLTAGQELNRPHSGTGAAERDVASGQAVGRRIHKPFKAF